VSDWDLGEAVHARVGVILLGISVGHAVIAQQILHPENLAGRWEAPDGYGGAVGMSISLTTTVPNSTTDLVDLPQTLEDFEIGIYQRSDSDVNPLGFNFFNISANGGATWDGQHLRIDLRQRAGISSAIHIDLAWHEATRIWTGIFERAAFRNQAITLRRPAGHQASPFVGTWFEGTGLMNNCLHIAQAQDGAFTGWGDDIQIPSRTRYANGILPPKRALEHYGEIAKAMVADPNHIEVELRAYTAACCSHPFAATISHDGNTLLGDWSVGPNQSSRPAKWTRVRGDSCASAASSH
jgi:hypothetical protein